jgi:cell division protein FtsQ
MRNWKEILTWTLLVITFFGVVGFSAVRRSEVSCTGLEISVNQDSGLFFVTREDVEGKIATVNPVVIGTRMQDINTNEIEKAILTLPEVQKVQTYLTIDGKLCIQVEQRRPIVRVIPQRGSGFYIDEHGKYMPLSKNYAARVLVVNGAIIQRFRDLDMKKLSDNDSIRNLTLFDEIYELAHFIDSDPFWKAQIQQAYVDENQDITLIPRVGSHNIELGNTTGLDKKFKRLMVFYKEGLPYSDWNIYSKISLKFDNQVVCTFKESPL